jgi:hypothetical protein
MLMEFGTFGNLDNVIKWIDFGCDNHSGFLQRRAENGHFTYLLSAFIPDLLPNHLDSIGWSVRLKRRRIRRVWRWSERNVALQTKPDEVPCQ